MKSFFPILLLCITSTIAQAQTPAFSWAAGFGDGSSFAEGVDIAVDASGNVVSSGSFSGTVDFDPGPATAHLIAATGGTSYISKLNAAGQFVWVKSLGAGIIAHAVDGSGNVYVLGHFTGSQDFDPGLGAVATMTAAGGMDVFIMKLDGSGNFVWAKQLGGASNDYSTALAIDGNGAVIITGTFTGTADFDPGAVTANLSTSSSTNDDIFVCKLDANGNYAWARRAGGAGDDYSTGIAVDGSGNVMTVGDFLGTVDFDPGSATTNLTSLGSSDMFVWKVDSGGNFVWARRLGGSGSGPGVIRGEYADDVAVDPAGNTYFVGDFTNTSDFDPGSGTFNLTATGSSSVVTNAFICKLDAGGSFVWAKQLGQTGSIELNDIALSSSYQLFLTGRFSGTVDFDPGAGSANLTATASHDIHVFSLDSSGAFNWAVRMAGTYVNQGNAVAIDASGAVHTTGFFFGAADFDPGPGTFTLPGSGSSSSAFVQKLGGPMSVVQVAVPSEDLLLFPNPAGTAVTLSSARGLKGASILLRGMDGRVMRQWDAEGKSVLMQMNGVAAGMYVVEVAHGEDVRRLKLMKQ